jgi:acetyl-CoA acetyltransferase
MQVVTLIILSYIIGINDGGCALLLASESKAKELKLPVLAKIVSFADAAQVE